MPRSTLLASLGAVAHTDAVGCRGSARRQSHHAARKDRETLDGHLTLDPVARPDARSLVRRQLFGLAVAFVVVSGVLAVLALVYLRTLAIRATERLSASFAQVIQEQTERSIQGVDQALQLVQNGLEALTASGRLNQESAGRLLLERSNDLPFSGGLFVLGPDGRIVFSSQPHNLGLDLKDRAYFQICRDNPGIPFYLGDPVRGRSTGTWGLPAARPLRSSEGVFTGLIVAGVQPDYFDQVWRAIELGKDSSISLLRRDGVLMMRTPFDDLVMGKAYKDHALFTAKIPSSPTGTYESASVIDGVKRIFAYRTLRAYPEFVVVVGQSYEAALASWRRLAALALGIWAVASIAVMLLASFLTRAWQNEVQSEGQAQLMSERLAMATRATSVAVWDWDVPKNRLYASPTYFTMLGSDPEEQLAGSDKWLERVHPDDRAEVARTFAAALAGEVASYRYEARLRHRDGSYRWVSSIGTVQGRGKGGRATRISGTREDITDRKRMEEALRLSEQRLRAIVDAEPECVKVVRSDGVLIEMNAAGLAMLEASSLDEVKERPLLEFIRPEYRKAFGDLHRRALAGKNGVLEFEVTGLRGTRRWLETHAAPLPDADGDVTMMLGITRDVTARKQSEAALRESAQRVRVAMQASHVGLWDWDLNSGAIVFSPEWKRLLGHDDDEIGHDFDEWKARIHPDDVEASVVHVQEYLAHPAGAYEAEFRMRHKDGSWRWIFARAEIFRDSDGAPARLLGGHLDITARKLAEEALRDSLREKSALLKEVHHRVKNNMQVVASLLRLEASRSGHAATQGVLKDMQTRIQAMAVLHETLYRTGNFAKVDLAKYFRQVINNLARSRAGVTGDVQLHFDIAPVSVELDQATPCGLIINELVSNAFKHAFPAGRSGGVWIELSEVEGGALRLRVSDDGVGPPADMEARRSGSLGLKLVSDLARQLNGSLATGPGSSFAVTFIPRRGTHSGEMPLPESKGA